MVDAGPQLGKMEEDDLTWKKEMALFDGFLCWFGFTGGKQKEEEMV